MDISRRVFLRHSVAVGVAAPVIAIPTAADVPQTVRCAVQELETLIAQQTGAHWSVMLAANERILIGSKEVWPLISYHRPLGGDAVWVDKHNMLGRLAGGEVL